MNLDYTKVIILLLIIFLFTSCANYDIKHSKICDIETVKNEMSVLTKRIETLYLHNKKLHYTTFDEFIKYKEHSEMSTYTKDYLNYLLKSLDSSSKIVVSKNNKKRFKFHSVIKNGILTISFNYFSKDLSSKVKKLILGKNVNKVIFNLKNNVGGSFEESIKLCDLFLDQGKIVSTYERKGTTHYFAKKTNEKLAKIPLEIHINKYTASSAEIFAGSMKYNKRAIIYGQPSYGKSTIQIKLDILCDADKHLLLTTKKYYFDKKTKVFHKVFPNIYQ